MENYFRDRYRDISNLLSSSVTDPALWSKISNQCLQETYLKMHGMLKTDLSLEIGAREATFSIQIKKIYGNECSVCAIEGSPKSHAYFSSTVDFKAKNIAYINAVMSSHDGQIDFYEYEQADEESSLGFSSTYVRDPNITEGCVKKRKLRVASIRGDSLIAAKYPDKKSVALWIDVEGAQQEVLSSFSGSFAAAIVNSVYIEVEDKKLWPEQSMLANDIIAHMQNLGFIPFLRDNEYFNAQYNILFVHKKNLDESAGKFLDYYMALLRRKLKSLIISLPGILSPDEGQ